jgi:predicted GNAT family N-acyltransferase
MKTCYTFSVKESKRQPMADLTYGQMAPRQWWIHRINVPEDIRGLKYGSQLLQEICDDADDEAVNLYLEIHSSGPLDRDALEAWYRRYGFLPNGWGIMRRSPNPPPSEHS